MHVARCTLDAARRRCNEVARTASESVVHFTCPLACLSFTLTLPGTEVVWPDDAPHARRLATDTDTDSSEAATVPHSTRLELAHHDHSSIKITLSTSHLRLPLLGFILPHLASSLRCLRALLTFYGRGFNQLLASCKRNIPSCSVPLDFAPPFGPSKLNPLELCCALC